MCMPHAMILTIIRTCTYGAKFQFVKGLDPVPRSEWVTKIHLNLGQRDAGPPPGTLRLVGKIRVTLPPESLKTGPTWASRALDSFDDCIEGRMFQTAS